MDSSATESGAHGRNTGGTATRTGRIRPAEFPAAGRYPVQRSHPCGWCGAGNFASAVKCRVCGTPLRFVTRRVQCSGCRHTQSTALVVCASCGAEIRPRPLQLPWLIPLLGAAAVLLILLNS